MIDLSTTTNAGQQTDPYYQEYPGAPGCADIAVIITAFNGAAFLDECAQSVLGQSLKPAAIVIVDDCSTRDNTLAVARSYERHGCRITRTPKNLGMCGARMFGLQGVTDPVIMFFDGDDVMPPDYLKTMRAELGANGFVYPGRQFFGSSFGRTGAHPPDRTALWSRNFCPSPSLMWRHVFDRAGAWQQANPEGTLPDWSLFLRMSGIAPFAASSMDCLVRRHESNYSGRRWDRPASEILGDTRTHAATLTVGMVYSGRLPQFQERWLATVAASLKVAGKTAELLVLDDSTDGFPMKSVGVRPEFTSVSIRRMPGSNFVERRKNPPLVSQFLAAAYNELLRCATGDLLWMIEDDILVPRNACRDLMRQILAAPGAPMPAACGCYRSRHNPERFILSSVMPSGEIINHTSPPVTPMPIQLTGTGCLMILRDLVRGMSFRPQWHHGAIRSNAHDWTFSSDLFTQNRPVMALPSVVCPHFHADGEFV